MSATIARRAISAPKPSPNILLVPVSEAFLGVDVREVDSVGVDVFVVSAVVEVLVTVG